MRVFHLQYVCVISDTVPLLVSELYFVAFRDIFTTLSSDRSHYTVSIASTTIDYLLVTRYHYKILSVLQLNIFLQCFYSLFF